MFKGVIILTVVIIWGTCAMASEYQSFHRGTRTLGMGGAFTAVADDQNALYFNPAGLSLIKGFSLGLFNPQVEVSKNSIDLFSDLSDVNKDDSGAVADVMRKYIGENNHVKLATDIYTGFKIGNVGVMVSAIGQATMNVRIRNPVWPEAHVVGVGDYGMMAGAGMDLPFIQGLKVGASIKGITRNSLDEVYTPDIIADDNFNDIVSDDQKTGNGVSADLGLLYTTNALKVSSLNLALVAQNIPEMDFGEAVDAKTQFNMGIALSQKLLGLTVTEAADIYDMTDNAGNDESYEKKVHLGVEVALPAILSVRAGLNQGYYTAGATLNFKIIKFDVATYGEELGVIGGQKEDRRFVGQVSMGWLW